MSIFELLRSPRFIAALSAPLALVVLFLFPNLQGQEDAIIAVIGALLTALFSGLGGGVVAQRIERQKNSSDF